MSFLSALGLGVDIVGGLAGIFGSDAGAEPPAALPRIVQGADEASEIAKALATSDLGPYSGLADDIQAEFVRGDAAAMKELMLADRQSRIRSASGLGIFEGDRRDEVLAREHIRNRETEQFRARDAARTYLTQSLQANKVAMGGFGDVANVQLGLNQRAAEFTNRQIEGGYQFARGVVDSLKNFNVFNTSPYGTPPIPQYNPARPSFVQEA